MYFYLQRITCFWLFAGLFVCSFVCLSFLLCCGKKVFLSWELWDCICVWSLVEVLTSKTLPKHILRESVYFTGQRQQSVDQFLSRLPQSVIKEGKIIDVRAGVANVIKVRQVVWLVWKFFLVEGMLKIIFRYRNQNKIKGRFSPVSSKKCGSFLDILNNTRQKSF